MVSDIRIKTSFRTHRKIKKLRRELGADGVLCLVNLWIGTAENEPSGVLKGWSSQDIEIEVDYKGEEGAFVTALVNFELLDVDESGVYSLHNWDRWQGWCIGAEARSTKASNAAKARWNKKNKCSEHYLIDTTSNATSIQGALLNNTKSNAPSPSPSPSPNTITASDDDGEVNEKPKVDFYLSRKKKELTGDVLKTFNQFWDAFDLKKGRAEAADAFIEAYSPEIFPVILKAARSEAIARETLSRTGKSPKWAQGWLTGRRWEDETEVSQESEWE